jgi:hypothetical protein
MKKPVSLSIAFWIYLAGLGYPVVTKDILIPGNGLTVIHIQLDFSSRISLDLDLVGLWISYDKRNMIIQFILDLTKEGKNTNKPATSVLRRSPHPRRRAPPTSSARHAALPSCSRAPPAAGSLRPTAHILAGERAPIELRPPHHACAPPAMGSLRPTAPTLQWAPALRPPRAGWPCRPGPRPDRRRSLLLTRRGSSILLYLLGGQQAEDEAPSSSFACL